MRNEKNDAENENTPLAPMVAERGIRNSKDFVDFMSALMADVVSGRVDPKVANAACVAGGHILKITKMQLDWDGQANNALPFTRDTKRLGDPINPPAPSPANAPEGE